MVLMKHLIVLVFLTCSVALAYDETDDLNYLLVKAEQAEQNARTVKDLRYLDSPLQRLAGDSERRDTHFWLPLGLRYQSDDVIIRVKIDEDGNTMSVYGIDYNNEELEAIVENTMLKWKYYPSTLHGKPVRLSILMCVKIHNNEFKVCTQ